MAFDGQNFLQVKDKQSVIKFSYSSQTTYR
jgi:hypothetical protein